LIEVKVFGAEPPCVKCKQVEQEARKAAAHFPGRVSVEKLSALSPEGVQFGFVLTPALVVNGRDEFPKRANSNVSFDTN
jgi:hypothetical protein